MLNGMASGMFAGDPPPDISIPPVSISLGFSPKRGSNPGRYGFVPAWTESRGNETLPSPQ